MSTFLYRLGRSSARHPFRVLGAWLVAAVAIMSLQGSIGGEFNDDFRVPGVESQEAADILTDRFPSQSGARRSHRVPQPRRPPRRDPNQAIVQRAREQLLQGDDVIAASDPFAADASALSADGQTAYVDVTYSATALETTHLDDATEAVASARDAGVQTEFSGNLAYAAAEEKGSEMLGIGVAVIVLLIAFGSVIAMGLPIVPRSSASSSAAPASACSPASATCQRSPT